MARRYGKTSNDKAPEKTLLEKKREKRAAVRLAAEAKQRREHPRSSPSRAVAAVASGTAADGTTNHNQLNSPKSFRGAYEYDYISIQTGPAVSPRRDGIVQSDSSGVSQYSDASDCNNRVDQINNVHQERKESIEQPISMEEHQNIQNGYRNFSQNEDNIEYYSHNLESYYDDQQQPQHPPLSAAAEEAESNPFPTRKPPKSPRRQPTTTTRIQASHVEDVLTLSLELERTRSALDAANAQLANQQSTMSTLPSQSDELKSQLLNNNTPISGKQYTLSQLMEEIRMEKIRSKAAEEDAALALELAKDAQAVKEECEEWLTRSLDEIEFWKNKCLVMEKEFGRQQKLKKSLLNEEKQYDKKEKNEGDEDDDDYDDGNEHKKLVRFKEDCPPSPVVSVEGDAMFHHSSNSIDWSTPKVDTIGRSRSFEFIPNSGPTPSKPAVANGRLYLHNASLSLSPNGALSPHPRIRASELMKRSAETRRILRERLTASGSLLDGSGPTPPPSMAHIAFIAAKSKGNNATCHDANQQEEMCKKVGNALHESGHRLKLVGKMWGLTYDVISTTTTLEAMVKEYCGQVEGKIDQQKQKIDELTAFCDHLEVDLINLR